MFTNSYRIVCKTNEMECEKSVRRPTLCLQLEWNVERALGDQNCVRKKTLLFTTEMECEKSVSYRIVCKTCLQLKWNVKTAVGHRNCV